MSITYYIKNDMIIDRDETVTANFNKEDEVYYDVSDQGIHVTLLDPAYVGQVVKVHMSGTETSFIWLDDGDDLTDVLPEEEVQTFTMTELARIELSYKKNITLITDDVPAYELTATSTRLTTVDQTRYDALIAAA